MSSPEFFDEKTHELLEEAVNYGVCSILVNNIIIQANSLPNRGGVRQIYNPDIRDFELPNGRRLSLRERFLSECNVSFRPVAELSGLKCGIDAELGYFEQAIHQGRDQRGSMKITLGVRSADNLTIPLADFYDMRQQQKERNKADQAVPKLCSYATIRSGFHTFGDNIIVTAADEKKVVIALMEERGLVLAKEVLELLLQLQTPEADQAKAKLIDYLSIDDLIVEALGLETGRDYGAELRLRKRISQIALGVGYSPIPTLVHEKSVAGSNGPATNRIEKIWLGWHREGERVLYQSYQFPGAMDTSPREVLRLTMGRRVGQAALASCIDEEKTTEQAVTYLDSLLSTQPSEPVPENSSIPDHDAEDRPPSRNGSVAFNAHLDKWIDKFELRPDTIQNIIHISQSLKEQYSISDWDIRLVGLSGKQGSHRLYITSNKLIGGGVSARGGLVDVQICLPEDRHYTSKIAKYHAEKKGSRLERPVMLPLIPQKPIAHYQEIVSMSLRNQGADAPIKSFGLLNRWIAIGERRIFRGVYDYVRFQADGDGGFSASYGESTSHSHCHSHQPVYTLPLIEVPAATTFAWGKGGKIKRL